MLSEHRNYSQSLLKFINFGFLGLVHNLSIRLIHFLVMGKNVAAGLGRSVNTHATSNDTLVLDDVQTSSAHKVIQGVSML